MTFVVFIWLIHYLEKKILPVTFPCAVSTWWRYTSNHNRVSRASVYTVQCLLVFATHKSLLTWHRTPFSNQTSQVFLNRPHYHINLWVCLCVFISTRKNIWCCSLSTVRVQCSVASGPTDCFPAILTIICFLRCLLFEKCLDVYSGSTNASALYDVTLPEVEYFYTRQGDSKIG